MKAGKSRNLKNRAFAVKGFSQQLLKMDQFRSGFPAASFCLEESALSACKFRFLRRRSMSVAFNRPAPKAIRTAIISANGRRRVFLFRAFVFRPRGTTPAPSF